MFISFTILSSLHILQRSKGKSQNHLYESMRQFLFHLIRDFNKLFYTWQLEVEQEAVTEKEAIGPLSSGGGSEGMLPQN